MKKWWLKFRIALARPSGRRKELRDKYFTSDGRLNPGADANNKVIMVDADGAKREIKDWYVPHLRVRMAGRDNTLVLEGPHNFHEVEIDFSGDGGYVRIGPGDGGIGSLKIWVDHGGRLEIGKNFKCHYNNAYWVDKGHIEIGDDCMFSRGILLRGDDGHDILDEQGRLISGPGHLKIGNHVWVGEETCLLKNAEVGDNSIVGARAVVTKKYPQGNVILAGNPARAIKELKGTWRE